MKYSRKHSHLNFIQSLFPLLTISVFLIQSCSSFKSGLGTGALLMLQSLNGSNSEETNVILLESDGSTYVTEGGTGDSISLILNRIPETDVTVELNADSPLEMSPSSVTFTANNWNIAQDITITASNNSTVESSPYPVKLYPTVTSDDSNYSNEQISPLEINVLDDDTAGLVVSRTTITVAEGGANNSYSIRLASQPSSSVTVSFIPSRSGEVEFSPATLTFTTANWDTDQIITTSAVDDSDDEDGTESISMRHMLESADPNFDGDGGSQLSLSILDNDPTTSIAMIDAVQSREVQIDEVAKIINAVSTPVSFNPVDPDRSIILCNMRSPDSNPSVIPTCQLNGSGEAVIETDDVKNQMVRFTVVQFDTGFSVQRGSKTLGPAQLTDTATINTVDPDRAFVIATTRVEGLTNSGTRTRDEERLVSVDLTDANTLTFTRGQSGSQTIIEYQIVEFSGARIQSGTTTITEGQSFNTAAIDAVDPGKSFLLFTLSASSDTDGIEGCYLTAGSYDDPTTLRFDRGSTCDSDTDNDDLTVSWFSVEMLDTTYVQNMSVTSTTTFENPAIATVDSTRAFVISSGFLANRNQSSDQDIGIWTGFVDTDNSVELQREASDSASSTVKYSVVELPLP